MTDVVFIKQNRDLDRAQSLKTVSFFSILSCINHDFRIYYILCFHGIGIHNVIGGSLKGKHKHLLSNF